MKITFKSNLIYGNTNEAPDRELPEDANPEDTKAMTDERQYKEETTADIALTFDDFDHSVLMIVCLGHCISFIVFFSELFLFYWTTLCCIKYNQNSVDKKINKLSKHNYQHMIATLHSPQAPGANKLHRLLLDNYHIYFA